MLINGQIFVYEPNGKMSLEEFVEKYSKAYAKGNPKITGICYRQTDIKNEEKILKAENNFDGFVKKMAWKMGCKCDNPQSYGRAIDIQTFFQNLMVNELMPLCTKEDKSIILKKIMGRKVDGIGPVYAIATLFFVSKGVYPIYDRFAHVAMDYLFEKKGYPKKGESRKSKYASDKALRVYDVYEERMKKLLRMLKKENANYIEYRDLDRALWVYGHGFNE